MPSPQDRAKSEMMANLNVQLRDKYAGQYDWSGYSEDEKSVGTKFLSEFDYFGGQDASSMLEEHMSKYRSKQDISKARGRYDELTNLGSEYNKSMYSRLSRLYKPDSYENTMLYAAMGLGSKSSAYLGQKATQQLERQGQDKTESAFLDARTRAESQAAGYLDMASGREQSLLKIMSDQRIQEEQLRQQKELEDKQRESQFTSSLINTGLGIGAMFIPGAQGMGASLLAKQFAGEGITRTQGIMNQSWGDTSFRLGSY